jgi:hypothetical protein
VSRRTRNKEKIKRKGDEGDESKRQSGVNLMDLDCG